MQHGWRQSRQHHGKENQMCRVTEAHSPPGDGPNANPQHQKHLDTLGRVIAIEYQPGQIEGIGPGLDH
jgi:hypothetical protein